MAYKYKGMGLSTGVMVAGKRWPGIYYVDSDGERTNRNLYSVGSIFAYRVLDAGYIGRWNLQQNFEIKSMPPQV